MIQFRPLALIILCTWGAIGLFVVAGWIAPYPALGLGGLLALASAIVWRLGLGKPVAASTVPATPADMGGMRRALGEAVLMRLPDPVLVLDSAGRVIRASKAAIELLGDNPIDRPLAAFFRAPALLDAVDQVAGGVDLRVIELTLRVPVERHLEAQLVRIDHNTGRRSPLLILFHDMTAIKRAERLRADFVANASHELKTPLTVLSGFIETLEGPAREDAQARTRFLTIMREQAARMARLVNDLLSLSRIELNEHMAPRDSVDLGAVVCDVADGLAMVAQSAKTSIEVRLPQTYPAVYGEREELVQAIQNLIDNAIKYGKPHRPIDVVLADAPAIGGVQRLSLSVRDYGDGIAREHIPRLTERFYRIDAVRSRERGGTGLGLAIVKHIVNRHRGQLTIESIVGEGSQFTIILPTVPESALLAPPLQPEIQPKAARKSSAKALKSAEITPDDPAPGPKLAGAA